MSRPGVLTLSGEAKNFVFDNMAAFRHHLLWILPLALVVEAANQAGHVMHIEWLPTATLLPTLILYGLFSLAWYRATLLGAHESYEFSLKRTTLQDWKFIVAFLLLSALFIVLSFLLQIGLRKLALLGLSPALLKVSGIAGAVAILCLMARLSFILPARALGTALRWSDWNRAAKGLTWPVVGSLVIFIVLLTVLITAYTFLVGAVVMSVAGDMQVVGARTAILGAVLSIPIYIGVFFFAALAASTVARAYQWGMENNPV